MESRGRLAVPPPRAPHMQDRADARSREDEPYLPLVQIHGRLRAGGADAEGEDQVAPVRRPQMHPLAPGREQEASAALPLEPAVTQATGEGSRVVPEEKLVPAVPLPVAGSDRGAEEKSAGVGDLQRGVLAERI